MANKLTLPKAVKIGVYDFKIVPLGAEESEATNLLGDMDFPNKVIRVNLSSGYREAAITLEHEIAHAVLRSHNSSRSIVETISSWLAKPIGERLDDGDFLKAIEERMIELVVEEMLPVKRDNPGVFQWISKGITGG